MSYSGKFKDKDNNLHPVTSVLYGTCDTAAATAAKVVTCTDFDALMTGVTIRVKFDNANTAANPTVNINSTGAKSVYRFGSTAPVDGNSWNAGEVVELVYDGTSFFMTNADNIGAKQDTLTFDNVPTDGSNNPVKSNGIYDALADKTDTDMVAADFNAGTSYTAGNYCVQDGKLYRFKNNHSGAWSASDVEEVKIAGELSSIKSGLINLTNDVKGAWQSITFSDVFTAAQDVTLSTVYQSGAYRRGDRIRLRIYVEGTLSGISDGYKTIGNLSDNYKPVFPQICSGIVNTSVTNKTLSPASFSINANGSVNVLCGDYSNLGNANSNWMGGNSISLEWSLT